MEPVWHVVREIWDRHEKCVYSEVISDYEEGDRESFKVAAAEAKELQDQVDAEQDDPYALLKETYSVAMW